MNRPGSDPTDPVDHYRTTRQHAGEAMKDGENSVGIVGVAMAVIALVVGLTALATEHILEGVASLVIGLAVGAVGLVWLHRAHRHVREDELHWHEVHSDQPAPPPTS